MEEHSAPATVSLNSTDPKAPSQAESTTSTSPTHTASTTWAQWDSKDAALLAPANLAVTKVQHAWERRPQSPFTRRRLKVGKVWKRTGGVSAPASSLFASGGGGATIRPESPLRAVKKMRGAAGEQVVRDWDVRGSPRNRRIVTRSNREEALLELGEDAAEQVEALGAFQEGSDVTSREEVLRVEIEHEDGTILELDPEEGEAEVENENWDDESMTEETVWDATLMHLAETIGGSEGATKPAHHSDGEHALDESLHSPVEDMDTEETFTDSAPSTHTDMPLAERANPEIQISRLAPPAEQTEQTSPVPQLKSVLKQTSQFGPMPEGFVSPVKERQRRTINQVRLSNANRRRTLPVNFAAQHPAVVPTSAESDIVQDARSPGNVDEAESHVVDETHDNTSQPSKEASELVIVPSDEVSGADLAAALDEEDSDIELGVLSKDSLAVHGEEVSGDAAHDDNAWEDVEEEEWPKHAEIGGEDSGTFEINPASEVLPSSEEQLQSEPMVMSDHAAPTFPIDTETSTVEYTTESQPVFELRRSPRRQSTSPVRRSGILPSSSRPHLVAFTPIKLPVYTTSVELQSSPSFGAALDDSMDIDNPTPLPQPTRSSSAPPEEPQMSPRRPKQPRISDDTALLQAFLNRAAESKTSKDGSTTAKRESMENRRDSTSVRQALASPAPLAKTTAGDVLADLDPNSPSPRKQFLAVSLADAAQTDRKSVIDQDEDELALNATPDKQRASRKSGRVKKKGPQVLPAGPKCISIRPADPVVVLKKDETHDTARMTRNNTKKNKSGAVLPPTRLTRLAAERLARADELGPQDDEDHMDVEVPVKAGRRAVKWAETLESFHEGANEPEMSMLSDELNIAEESSAPPPSNTPSKPAKLRRLRTPRPTASSSGSIGASEEAVAPAVAPAGVVAKPSKATKRSSRIATPAKLPGAAKSLLPDGLNDATEAAPVSASKKAPISRKRAPSSKLPAPASSLTASAAVGKENSLIASPPKKRARAAPASAVPKLDFKSSMDAAPVMAPPAIGIAASPAKKGSARAQVLFKENGDVSVKRDEVMGMGSPAKKRVRRIL
ncbi:uncharacterized protein RCC_12072 [Ramularia collo-cygni]|uniref:Uncharacterized protein n=1 Tax=Ramularia collo-cygni TaxID=112498 RepID=A0A2D3UR61_9PEZI|nr:uncharacterized protein RCC_12072 [Ramularia collo-cygni]CZT14850.1 uncharacterized protein RCC_12072 [Ramularia collo-cygni]